MFGLKGIHAALSLDDAALPNKSGRKSHFETAPLVARSIAIATSAEICGASFASQETPCCESPIFSARAFCEPTSSIARRTCWRNFISKGSYQKSGNAATSNLVTLLTSTLVKC
jgi:hypothetical protein